MAKKNDAAYEAFLADLISLKPEIKDLVSDEAVSAKLREGVLARSEFSRGQDELREARKALEAEVTEARDKIAGWQNWYGETSKQVADMQTKLKTYAETYGDLDEPAKHREAAKQGLTKEEFDAALQAELNKHDMAALKFADDLTDLKIEHRDRFKEKLDTAAVYKIAGEKNLPLGIAYNEYIADRVAEKNKADFEQAIKAAKEEGAKEFASKHNLPVVPNTNDLYVHSLDAKDVPQTSKERVAAAVNRFNNLISQRS